MDKTPPSPLSYKNVGLWERTKNADNRCFLPRKNLKDFILILYAFFQNI